MQIGMIGLGAMGLGMARNLAKAGYLQAVYNRTTRKADALGSEFDFLKIFATPQTLADYADVIMTCVSADRDVLEIVSAITDTIKPGSIVIDMSTISSHTAQQAAALLKVKQVGFLDAPVSGGVEGANNGTLAMMVGGEIGVLNRVKPILQAMASRIEYFGPSGSGQACKAVNQLMCAGINQAVTEALAFAQAQNLDLEKVIDVISTGAAGNWFLQHRGKTMTKGIYLPGFKLALHHKDLLICQQMAEKVNLDSPLSRTTLQDYEYLMQQGFGDEDISALYRLKQKR